MQLSNKNKYKFKLYNILYAANTIGIQVNKTIVYNSHHPGITKV